MHLSCTLQRPDGTCGAFSSHFVLAGRSSLLIHISCFGATVEEVQDQVEKGRRKLLGVNQGSNQPTKDSL